jgi:DNA-binding MarR family transcriptional regulator
VLAQPKRLAALAMCAATSKVTFALIRDHLELRDSDASKQMQKLVDCGYVEARKTGRAANRQTWFTITDQGRNALGAHVEALNAIIRAELPPPQ